VTREAVEPYLQLASDRPAVYNPDLALCLNNLSLRLSNQGHEEDALNATEEADELHCQFAEKD